MIEKTKKWLGTGSINLFGLPFTGKDTQGQRLVEIFGAYLLGGGSILRASNNLADSRKIMEAGGLTPTDVFETFVLPKFADPNLKDQPLILNSVGRWHGEERAVLETAKKSGHQIKAVVFLELDEKLIKQRWQKAQQTKDRGRRADDTWQTLQKRLEEFRQKTLPVIDYYQQMALLIEVDGSLPPGQVTKQILSKLAKFANHA